MMNVFRGKISELPVNNLIYGWIFLGIWFSENINGRTLCRPSIALTFSSNICIIPGRLLPSRACFRLYRCNKNSTKYSVIENNSKEMLKNLFVNKKKSNFGVNFF